MSRTAATVRGPQGVAGLGRWRGTWSALLQTTPTVQPPDGLGAYASHDLVVYQGTTYRANTTPTTGVSPVSNLQWDIVAQSGANGSNGTSGVSFTFQGAWVSGTPYIIGQWVSYGGNLYYCNGAIVNLATPPNLDTGWDLGMAGSGAGLVSGEVATVGIRAGGYLTPVGCAAGSTTTVSLLVCYAAPLYVPKATTVDRIGLYINPSAVAGALYRLGIYADVGAGPLAYPGALLLDAGTTTTVSSTYMELTVSPAFALARGLYWVAGRPEVAYTSARSSVGPVAIVPPAGGGSSSDLSAGYISNQAASSSALMGTWPAWGVSGTGTINNPARVLLRVTG